MPIFPNVQNVVINDSYFTEITNNLSGPTGIDTLREAANPDAAHDSSARHPPPQCHPGTRAQYIEDITHWAHPAVGITPPPIYWMKGPAGVGKSAIAQTCAEKLERSGKLGAAFFFSINGRNKPEQFFPSIAYQLSTIHPAYRNLLDKKIRHDRTLVDKAMPSQFRYLIDEPLRQLETNGEGMRERVVIVDGLDECEGAGAQCEIIRIIAEATARAVPLRWAFFSRPELHIEATFSRTGVTERSYKVLLPISRNADGEIKLYLRAGFENIAQQHRIHANSAWPANNDMKVLVGAASGSFIYATTVIRFVAQLGSLGPEKRLRAIIEVILNRRKPGSHVTAKDAPFAELDAFYMLIMQRVPTEISPSIHLLLSLLCQAGGSSTVTIANMLRFSRSEIEIVCGQMSAVVRFHDSRKAVKLDPAIDTSRPYTQVSHSLLRGLSGAVGTSLGGNISFYHKSFADFLLDPTRSGRYCIKTSTALAEHQLKLHDEYDKSYCWEGSELVLAPNVPNSSSSLSFPAANELVNSLIKAWVYAAIGNRFPDKYYLLLGDRGLEMHCDFRKNLYIFTSVCRSCYPSPDKPFQSSFHDYSGTAKALPGILIIWLRGSEFRNFDVIEFKQIIEKRRKAKILRPYYRDLTSRIESLFPKKTQGQIESGLYRIGHGTKSIFWSWEINHELQHYRELRAIDLAEGERIYQQERFELWPQPRNDSAGN